jgi:NhaP-type Na+/H+ or K+/H+ antiporter
MAVTLGPAVGVAVGWLGARGLQRGVGAGWINPPFQRLSSLGLAFFAFAAAELVGGNGFIAAFTAGLTLGNVGPDVCPSVHEFGETEGQLLTLLVFFIFGAVLVPEATPHFSLPVLGYALASLTVVRMLPVALALAGWIAWIAPKVRWLNREFQSVGAP